MTKKMIISGSLMGGLLILLCTAGVIFLYWRQKTMPIYTLGERTLTSGTTTYVSESTELPLEPVNENGWVTQIGKTSGGMTVHAIPEQPDHGYLFIRGFMFPQTVFRREDIAPISLQDLDVTSMELLKNVGLWPLLKTTHDAAIIENVRAALLHQSPVENVLISYFPYHINLISKQLPGLVYVVYVAADKNQVVYVAERMESEKWVQVDGAFAEWVFKK